MDDRLVREVAEEYIGFMGPKAAAYCMEQARIAKGHGDHDGAATWCEIAVAAWRLLRVHSAAKTSPAKPVLISDPRRRRRT